MTDVESGAKLPDNFDEVMRKEAIKAAREEEKHRIATSRKVGSWNYKTPVKKTYNKKMNHRKWIIPRKSM